MHLSPLRAKSYDSLRPPRRLRLPPPHDPIGARFFTALARFTGLTRAARAALVRQLEQVESQDRMQHLYRLLNRVVDGGWPGLWTCVRVCAGTV